MQGGRRRRPESSTVNRIVVQLKRTGAADASLRASLEMADVQDPVHPLDAVLALHPEVSGRPLFSAPAGTQRLREGEIRDRRLTWVLSTDEAAWRQPHPGLNVLELPPGVRPHAIVRMLRADPRIEYAHLPAPRQQFQSGAGADPKQGKQWALDRCGFPEAWNVTDPIWGAPTPVAVVDSGIDTLHDDLRTVTRLFTFGLPADDVSGHGTCVAGILAAVRGNDIGISGGARCGLEVYKVFSPSFVEQNYYDTLEFLAKSEVRVINLSIGGTKVDPTEQQLIQKCLAAGKIIVTPMGNTTDFASGATVYPAALPQVIAVGSTDQNDRHASFSLTGDHIWISAPGTSLLTTLRGGGYGSVSGTSYSAPLVAAACALMCRKWPDLDAVRARTLLSKLVSPVDGQTGWNPAAGHGRLDLRRLATI
jgi:thermitase